jgi:hypothetical protein
MTVARGCAKRRARRAGLDGECAHRAIKRDARLRQTMSVESSTSFYILAPVADPKIMTG